MSLEFLVDPARISLPSAFRPLVTLAETPKTLLHVHLAGLDEVAAVGPAARIDAKPLLKPAPSILVKLIVGEVGEAGLGYGAGHEQGGFIQIEAGAGGTLLVAGCTAIAGRGGRCGCRATRVRHCLVGGEAALHDQSDGVRKVELDVLVQLCD